MTTKEVIEKYQKAISAFRPKTFAWPGDSLCGHKWQYWVHVSWVKAWNEEGRETECLEFLTNWLTEDNVNRALEEWRDWEGMNDMDQDHVEELLASLKTEREKFTRSNEGLMAELCWQLVECGVYPAQSQAGYSALEMVENYGVRWFEYDEPHFCPHCNADLRDLNHGTPFKREIGFIENDRLQYFACPDCGEKI